KHEIPWDDWIYGGGPVICPKAGRPPGATHPRRPRPPRPTTEQRGTDAKHFSCERFPPCLHRQQAVGNRGNNGPKSAFADSLVDLCAFLLLGRPGWIFPRARLRGSRRSGAQVIA